MYVKIDTKTNVTNTSTVHSSPLQYYHIFFFWRGGSVLPMLTNIPACGYCLLKVYKHNQSHLFITLISTLDTLCIFYHEYTINKDITSTNGKQMDN